MNIETHTKVIVIIPAYNEEESLSRVVSGVLSAVPAADVVVIDVMESGGIATGYWNLDRGNHLRTGYYQSSLYCGNVYPGDLNCDQNLDILDVIFVVVWLSIPR